MDERIHEHAETLVDWSARVEAGDDVVLSVSEGAHDLAVAVAEAVGERGANLLTTYGSSEVQRAYVRNHDGDFDEPGHELAMYEAADVLLRLGGGRNTAAMADVQGDAMEAASKARQDVREARMDTRWVSTVHPTRSLAQQAGMSHEAYADFVYEAILRDWEALADEMAQLKDVLDAGSEVRLLSEDADLAMRVDDRSAVNSAASVDYDSHNLPSGEVFTAPSATEGTVRFDVPMTLRGRRVRDVRLTFEDGEVVDFAASQGEAVVEELLDVDEGARRLGELGVGMNRGIDRPTDSILFDEKMAGTVHLALGRAYDANLPGEESGNDSAVHVDLITDLRDGGELRVDGDVVQKDGVFRWEDGFEG
jgi:aminopeptidase